MPWTLNPPRTRRRVPRTVPEADIYFRLLILHHLLSSPSTHGKAVGLAQQTVEKMQALNRRSMDPIASKIWFAVERAYELGGELADARPLFLAAQRTASLRHDDETQASLINRLLRSYLHYSLYDQADKLISKTTFPVSAANSQHARYHYFLGRIKAVQLNYSEAHINLQQAIRRAPPRRPLLVSTKLYISSVRTGSLSQFQSTLSKHAAQFEADKTYTLIVRLRQNVIKTGIRRLSLSYSRISLRDICVKLHLDSEEDAEYIVGKAIRDGVIEGRIIHEKGWMECGNQKSGYGPEVSDAFSRRIGYCLELHNESVKVGFLTILPLIYILSICRLCDTRSTHIERARGGRGCQRTGKHIAKGIEDGDIDDDDMGGDF
ncbi:26S proteasome non-ATPase regulatory [Salix suchowensis]|nr:26S proteasome non-ATPase regulatory [Salix suchowensis]